MNNFTFQNPVKLIFGKGSIAKLAKEIPADKKIMVTFGGGSVKKNGVYDQVVAALKGRDFVEFWGIEPNPKIETLRKAIALDPENITVHTLTLKRASNIVVEHRAADYADVAAMLDNCSLLADAGYRPYYMYRQKGTLQNLENIGWAKPGFECLYNIYIMEEVHTILSAGAGGSTKLVIPGQRRGKIERIFNFKYPTEYIDRFAELLDRKKAVEDFYARYTSQTLCQP